MKRNGRLNSPKMTNVKTIETLVDDIYSLFDPDTEHVPSEDNLNYLAENIKEVFRKRFAKDDYSPTPLRFSNLGKPDRQIWYEGQSFEKEKLGSKVRFKFLYGDLLEVVALFLAKEAGHEVVREQEEVSVDGVLGHIDCLIDGVVTDVKSANQHAFKKFEKGDIYDDVFLKQYIDQLCGYSNVLTPGESPAFFTIDKTVGGLHLTRVASGISADFKPEVRIAHLKEVLASETPPPRCYDDEDDGKSGNRKLSTGCQYCSFKFRCWEGLRGFAYSGGPRWLTKVNKLPDVPEITKNES